MADKIAKRGVSIFIDGKEVKNSVGSIASEMKKLEAQQRKMTIGSDEYVAHAKKIEYLKSLLVEHKENQKKIAQEYKKMTGAADEYGKKHESIFSKAANWFNKYSAMGIGLIGTITGISLGFRKLAEDIAKLDDVYSDVMKTTQMTHDEVIALNEEFKKFDTRTPREELNKIAEAGGRIGVAKENILKFTKAMDIANVALGDSFTGGVEEISTKLGKLKMLFAETKNMKIENAYLSIASSINELGANGAASEANIAEFTTRVGSMQEALKPSIADALALGAAFEESGLEAEIASRAYSIVLNRATTESAKFAKVMGKSKEEIESLINSNPLEFFLQFAQSMRGMSAIDVGNVLDDLKINAEGANKALGAATNNTERFRELLELSNNSFKEGTSVINEYNIKNNNLAAKLDKAKKAFNETALELGAKLNPLLLKSVSGTTYLIKALVQLPKWLAENKGMIISLVLVTGAYTVAINANRIATLARLAVEKSKILLDKISTASTLAAAAAQALFTGNIKRAAAAMRLFNMVVGMNPYIAVGVALAAVTVGIYKLVTRTTDAQKAIKEFNREAHIQTTELNNIFEAYKKANPGTAEKARLLQIIKEKYGSYIQHLIDEKGNITDIEKAQKLANTALRESIALKVKDKYVQEFQTKELENQADLLTNLRNKIAKQKGETVADVIIGEIGFVMQKNMEDPLKKGLPKVKEILKNNGLLSNGATSGSFNKLANSLASSYFRIGLKTKEFDAIFKGLVGDVKKVADVANGNVNKNDTDNTTPSYTPTASPESNDKKSPFQLELEALEETRKAEELVNKKFYADGSVDEEVYNEWMLQAKKDFLAEKLALQQKYGLSTVDTETEIAETIIAENEASERKILEEAKKTNAEIEVEERDHLKALEQIRNEFGLQSVRLRYEEELELLKAKLAEEKASEEETARAIRDLKIKWAGETAQNLAFIADNASGIVNNIVEAETLKVENEYNDRINAARKAGQDTTAIEEEKEQKVKEVKKKYADLDFAITVAKIIANTSQAVMKMWAEGGVFGPVLAGFAGAAGLAEIAVANQQREAVKNLWTGGFTGPGGKYEPKGIVHGNEFVSNSDALANPNLMPLFNVIDTAQRMGTVRSLKANDLRRALSRENEETTSIRRKPSGTDRPDNNSFAAIEKYEKAIDRLNNILDNGIEARSVISGRNGSYEQTKKYERYINNASR